ncbi:hypothetical protein BD309DRAFT_1028466, partial [Dichomitus squalens]
GVLVEAAWIPGTGCAITQTSNRILAATFIYTICFNFTVLTLMAVKLGVGSSSRRDRSKIVKLTFDDGLFYCVVAFGAYVIATTFMLVNLNAVMSIIANVPAAIASNIVACRVVRRLTNYTSEGAEVFGYIHPVATPCYVDLVLYVRLGLKLRRSHSAVLVVAT